MQRRLFEATNGLNWGKFLVCRFSDEWAVKSALDGKPLIRSRGWGSDHLLVVDLQTGEGALLPARPGGCPHADLEKRRIWVCPMMQPFLEWLYRQDVDALLTCPLAESTLVDLPSAGDFAGYRRPGIGGGALVVRLTRQFVLLDDSGAEWHDFHRVPDAAVEDWRRAADEAAVRAGVAVHVDVVPDDYEVSLKRVPDCTVIRVGDSPAPWVVAT